MGIDVERQAHGDIELSSDQHSSLLGRLHGPERLSNLRFALSKKFIKHLPRN